MNGRIGLIALVLLGPGIACIPGPTQNSAVVPGNPFSTGAAGTPPVMPELSPESKQESIRVLQIGQEVLGANPQLPIKPQFIFIGEPAPPAIFHRGSQDIVITETLSRQCKTEGQLVALLCHELGQQVAERQALQHFSPRSSCAPPPDFRIGNDYQSTFGPSDGTRMTELGKRDQEERERLAKTFPPDTLARIYLQKTGNPPELLGEIAPLLKAANQNSGLEKQFTNHSPLPPG